MGKLAATVRPSARKLSLQNQSQRRHRRRTLQHLQQIMTTSVIPSSHRDMRSKSTSPMLRRRKSRNWLSEVSDVFRQFSHAFTYDFLRGLWDAPDDVSGCDT